MLFVRFCLALLCLAGLTALAVSDAMYNINAAPLATSGTWSEYSHIALSVGIVVSCVCLGAMWAFHKGLGVSIAVIMATLLTGALSLISGSSDYSASSQASSLNETKIESLQAEKSALLDKMNECKMDRYYKPCQGAEARIVAINDKLENASVKVDVEESVFNITGIPGHYITMLMVFGRAFFLGFLVTILTKGFFYFLIGGDASNLFKFDPNGGSDGTGGPNNGSQNRKKRPGRTFGTFFKRKRELKPVPTNTKTTIENRSEPKSNAKKTPGPTADQRKKIKEAAFRLIKEGKKPTVEAVRKLAKMSKSTVCEVLRQERGAIQPAEQKKAKLTIVK